MLTTCFGCCSLRFGVRCFVTFNLLWNILELIKHGFHRYVQYEKKIMRPVNLRMTGTNTTESEDNNMIEQVELIPAMSGIFMDYLFFVCYGWIVLELIVNIGLKRATFKHATHYIYAWLIVYHGNLIFMITHMGYYAVKKFLFSGRVDEFVQSHIFHDHEIHFVSNSIYITIVATEIIIIHSYYIAEEKVKLQNFVQIKRKHVSRREVVSRGVNLPSATNFNEITSHSTQEGSKTLPYITNILQD